MEPRVEDMADLVTDPAVRSFIGQPTTPSSLSLAVRTNSDLIHCSSTGTLGRTSTSFRSDKHSLKLLDSFNRFRKDGHLCDVKLKVGNRTFSAHKAILAGSCPYFEAMFTSEMAESRLTEIE